MGALCFRHGCRLQPARRHLKQKLLVLQLEARCLLSLLLESMCVFDWYCMLQGGGAASEGVGRRRKVGVSEGVGPSFTSGVQGLTQGSPSEGVGRCRKAIPKIGVHPIDNMKQTPTPKVPKYYRSLEVLQRHQFLNIRSSEDSGNMSIAKLLCTYCSIRQITCAGLQSF